MARPKKTPEEYAAIAELTAKEKAQKAMEKEEIKKIIQAQKDRERAEAKQAKKAQKDRDKAEAKKEERAKERADADKSLNRKKRGKNEVRRAEHKEFRDGIKKKRKVIWNEA
jgi:hypothetical protein